MGFTSFMVVLDPEKPVYLPGQTVEGYLSVRALEAVSCRKITVTIKGQAKVHWSEKSGKNRRHYRSEEVYFRHPVIVWSGEDTSNTMNPGDRKFPFSFILPRDIPSSFISHFGKVIYQVKAEADRPWTLDSTHKVFFSVNFMYDLNQDPHALIPIRIQQQRSVCCAGGPIDLNMTAQRSGYVPGESIVVNGEIVNHSSSTVDYTEIKLVQVITFITKSKRKTVDRTVQRVYHPQLEGGGRDLWSSVPLPIPAVPASHLKHCNIITIDYIFILVAKLGICRKARVKVPVIIGTLPLQTTYSNFVPQSIPAQFGGTTVTINNPSPRSRSVYPHRPSAPSYQPSTPSHSPSASSHSPTAPPQQPYSSDPPPYSASFLPDEYRDVPPPSYASCVFGGGRNMGAAGDDGAEESDDGSFAPHYLTYRTQT